MSMIEQTSEIEREKILIGKEMRNIFHIFDSYMTNNGGEIKQIWSCNCYLGKIYMYENAELLCYFSSTLNFYSTHTNLPLQTPNTTVSRTYHRYSGNLKNNCPSNYT